MAQDSNTFTNILFILLHILIACGAYSGEYIYASRVFAGEISRKVNFWKLSVGERIILKWIPRLVGRDELHLFIWFMIRTSGGILWAW